ncbi:MAG: DUF3108 domain-containing protein [Alistipes sp.]|nr:DUF3108 domain-containing protein [Alistipes sp.]
MRRLFTFIILFFAGVLSLQAQLYVPGETLNYKLSYKAKLFPNTEVAKVVMRTTETTLDGAPSLQVYGFGETAKAFSWILPVSDTYKVWIDPKTLRTSRFEADLHEGDYTFKSTYLFDWENQKVHTRWSSRGRAEKKKTMNISPNSMDAVSLYYNLRTVPDSLIKEGFARDLEMVLEDTVRFLSFRYDGREVKKVKNLGRFNTIKFRCKIATSDGFAFRDGTEFIVWISDDRNKIPLYIESPIKVGSVCAYLSSYEGLRYPLDCFIKK